MFIILAVSLGAARDRAWRWSGTPRGAADGSAQQRQYAPPPVWCPFTLARAAMSPCRLESSIQILSNPRLKGACLEGSCALDSPRRGAAIAAAVAVAGIVGGQSVGFRCQLFLSLRPTPATVP